MNKLELLKNYIIITLNYVDRKKLSDIFNFHGYQRESVDANTIFFLMLKNREFAYDYGMLVKEAFDTREWQTAVRTGMLDFADGNGKQGALDWIGKMTDGLSSVTTSISGLLDTLDVKGVNKANAEAALLAAQQQQMNAQKSVNLSLILGISGAVLLLVIAIIFIKKKA